MILAICGQGGSAREILELAEQINNVRKKWEDIIFIVDKIHDNVINGKKVYLLIDAVKQFNEKLEFTISFGEPSVRTRFYKELADKDLRMATLIHPGVHIPISTTVDIGTIIMSNAFISVDVVIGKNVFIQPNSVIGHETKIGDNSVISALTAIPGKCSIGKETYIALNSCVKEETTIGDCVIVSMGSVVKKDIPDNVIVDGQPAKIISKNYLHQVFHM